MNGRNGRDSYDDGDNDARDDWDDRSQREGRAQRDLARGERGERARGNWGASRSWDSSSGQRDWNRQDRQQSPQAGRYGYSQYERGEPYSGQQSGSGYGAGRGYAGGNYGLDSYSGGRGYAGGNYDSGNYGSGNYGSSNYGSSNYGSSNYGSGDSYGQYGRNEQRSSGRSAWDSGRGQESFGGLNVRSERSESYGASREGGFFGKGPKGYTRSDDRIREDVCDRLSDDDEVDASDITVTVTGGEVTLEGTVPDRRSKHRAEDIADAVSGVRDVHNSLRPRKGLLQEVGDRVTGRAEAEQHGHTGSGTRNSSTSGSSGTSSPTSAIG